MEETLVELQDAYERLLRHEVRVQGRWCCVPLSAVEGGRSDSPSPPAAVATTTTAHRFIVCFFCWIRHRWPRSFFFRLRVDFVPICLLCSYKQPTVAQLVGPRRYICGRSPSIAPTTGGGRIRCTVSTRDAWDGRSPTPGPILGPTIAFQSTAAFACTRECVSSCGR